MVPTVKADGFYIAGALRSDSMVEDITPDELNERLKNGDDVQVIDIRTPDGYAEGHIPGAENIPFERFAREVQDHEWSDDVVVVCPMGQSSQQAARLLESYEGVSDDARVVNLEGGYEAWDYDLETEH